MKPEFLQYAKDRMTVDDMPNEDMKFLAVNCGVDIAITVMEKLGGSRFFVPNQWSKYIAERFIRERSGEFSVRELVVITGQSDTFINKILNQKAYDGQIKNQTSLFEM